MAFCQDISMQVLVMESVADELVSKVKAGVDKLSVGRPEVRSLSQASFADCHHLHASGYCSYCQSNPPLPAANLAAEC